ncbi:MAG: RidA family protein [Acidobacteria bacterium]|nr:RidA family protein [Acidobacteriota bacterium]
MKMVTSSEAPAAVGPYSHGVISGGLLFTSGQIPIDPGSGEIAGGGFEDQARQALENLDAVLRAAGSSRSRVIKVTVFLTDMGKFGRLNEIYGAFFGEHRPARSALQVAALPKNVEIEVEAIAEVG